MAHGCNRLSLQTMRRQERIPFPFAQSPRKIPLAAALATPSALRTLFLAFLPFCLSASRETKGSRHDRRCCLISRESRYRTGLSCPRFPRDLCGGSRRARRLKAFALSPANQDSNSKGCSTKRTRPRWELRAASPLAILKGISPPRPRAVTSRIREARLQQ